MMDTHQISLRLPHQFFDVIKARAVMNHRSVNQEILFLLECGLGSQNEVTREFIRLLNLMGEETKIPSH